MPLKSRMLNPQLHIRTYNDALLIKATGTSWSEISRTLGYSCPSNFSRKLRKYKNTDTLLPLHLSCLIETALWRLGKMDTFINIKKFREGPESVLWHLLPR
jgi:hypothetical protein